MVRNSFEILKKSNKLQCWIKASRIGKKITSSMSLCYLYFQLAYFKLAGVKFYMICTIKVIMDFFGIFFYMLILTWA